MTAELVKSGLWEECNGLYRFHDWDDMNPTPSQKAKQREDNARKLREWRARKEASRTDVKPSCNPVTHHDVTSPPSPSPSPSLEILQTAKAVCASAPPTAGAAPSKPKKPKNPKPDKASDDVVPNEVREARAKVREHFKLRWAEASDAQPEAYFWAARQNVSLNERLRHITNTHRGDVAAAADAFCVLIDRCYLNRRPAWKWAKGDVPKWESFIESLEELAKAKPEPHTNGHAVHRSANNGGVSPAYDRALRLHREIEEEERAQRPDERQSGTSSEAASPVSIRVLGPP